MQTSLRIGFVGGNGWIGGSLARALVASRSVSPDCLTLPHRSTRSDWLPDATWTRDSQVLADASDVVVLSVRPQNTDDARSLVETDFLMSEGEFQHGDSEWFEPRIGGCFYNPPCRHAMRSGARPLLAIWAHWVDPTRRSQVAEPTR